MTFALTPEETAAILISLRVALTATLVSLPFGLAVAWLLARKAFYGKALIETLVHVPLVLPPVVVGTILMIALGRNGPVGAFLADTFGFEFKSRWTGAALAAGVMGFPLLVRPIRLSLEAVDRGLEGAAATLGASPAKVFLTVTLPLALPGLIAGTVLCFARALGEFGATITFAGAIPGETQTLATALGTLVQGTGLDVAALRLIAAAILVSLAALVVSDWLARRAAMRLHGG